jgi:hypothetical protein
MRLATAVGRRAKEATLATTPIPVTVDRQAVKYTGTNSGEIAALIPDFTVTSETAAGLNFTSLGTSYMVPVGGYVTWWEGAVRETPFANEDDFHDVYREAVAMDHVHELKLRTGVGLPAEDTDY